MKKIKPIISYYGSKYRMLDKIFNLLELKSSDIFLDLFGGSGIVGVNAKHLFNCQTIIMIMIMFYL
ncbi:DNA adenine methylase [Mycoplasma capricolum]|uniref:DNA adenine methylase n=1 Tax=Mycoplasma capricolum TaxID=2095 RepID=UPI003DA4B93B